MRFFGYPYNDLVICKDSPDYLTFIICARNEKNSDDTLENQNQSVCSLGVSCNEMIDTPMLLVVQYMALV